MSVKFLDMKFDGRKYKDKNGIVWEPDGTKDDFCALIAEYYAVITNHYTHKQLVNMEFEEVIDWSEVPIDTKILVWNNGDKQKEKRHFAGINEYGMVEAWNYGQTSFTIDRASAWDYAELYKEESEK